MTITIYSKPNCVNCKTTKMMLSEFDYKDIDVEESTEAKEYVKSKGVRQLPYVEIQDGAVTHGWYGLNRYEIMKLKRGD